MLDVRQYGKEVIIVLELNYDIGSMTSLRMVTGHLGHSNEGFKVPNDVLVEVEGQIGIVVLNDDKTRVFVPIEINEQNHFEAVISVLSTSNESLYTGQILVKP